MSEIFNSDQIEKVTDFLEVKDAKGLRAYLSSINAELEKKGVIADYMFYVLCNNLTNAITP